MFAKEKKMNRKKFEVFKYCLFLPMHFVPCFYLIFIFVNIICALIPTMEIYLWKKVLELLQDRINMYRLLIVLVVYITLSILCKLADSTKTAIEEKLIDKIHFNVDLEIMKKYSCLDADFYDNPSNMEKIDLVKNSKMSISEGVLWPVKIIKAILQYSSVTFLLFKFSPILSLIFIVTSVPQAISTTKLEADLNQSDIDTLEEQRKKEYYRSILIDKKYAKDLRIYRCREYFTEKYQNEWNKVFSIKEYMYKASFSKIYRNELVRSIGYIYIMINTFYRVINGMISIGDLSIVINATKSSSEAFDELFGLFIHFRDITTTRINIYLDFLKYESKIKSGLLQCPDDFDIEFRNVFFRYPNNEKNTLEDISFKLHKGTKNAIVGKNGEGKSTIIKLLLRLYDPQQGKILINGIDIKELDVISLRKKFAVCLQEIVKYAMTVEENITFSDMKTDRTEIENITRLSGINSKINSFEKKYKTELTKEFFEEGEELSGGQWQMMAIARALYNDADYWIMDEPSSSLDPVSEDKMMEMLSQCSKEKTTLVISHRLSSLKKYDQIIVLENKKIIEIGNHKELLSKNGLYAEMYNLQKSKYEMEKK